MNRREALEKVAWLLGGSIIGADVFLQGCKPSRKEKTAGAFFDADEISFLDEVAETILPKTNTPGAKDAKVGEFMNVMVRDCYTKDDQKIFKEGMKKIDKAADKKFDAKFMKLSPQQKTDLLNIIDKEQNDYHKNKKDDEPAHYFRMMRELTLLGYFTSEACAKHAMRYVPVPGKYEPCIDYKKGEGAWAGI